MISALSGLDRIGCKSYYTGEKTEVDTAIEILKHHGKLKSLQESALELAVATVVYNLKRSADRDGSQYVPIEAVEQEFKQYMRLHYDKKH